MPRTRKIGLVTLTTDFVTYAALQPIGTAINEAWERLLNAFEIEVKTIEHTFGVSVDITPR